MGPELEAYALLRLPLEGELGLVFLAGLAWQGWAWYPPWYPEGFYPLVEVEPEIELRTWPAFGLGLSLQREAFGAYILWHSRRGPLLGLRLAIGE